MEKLHDCLMTIVIVIVICSNSPGDPKGFFLSYSFHCCYYMVIDNIITNVIVVVVVMVDIRHWHGGMGKQYK